MAARTDYQADYAATVTRTNALIAHDYERVTRPFEFYVAEVSTGNTSPVIVVSVNLWVPEWAPDNCSLVWKPEVKNTTSGKDVVIRLDDATGGTTGTTDTKTSTSYVTATTTVAIEGSGRAVHLMNVYLNADDSGNAFVKNVDRLTAYWIET